MKVTRGYQGRVVRSYPVATIGNFDGHHVGHRTLLQAVVDTARNKQGTALVLTFDPHPVKILAPQVDLRFLTSPEEKLDRFRDAGIDEVVFLEFDQVIAALPPEAFVDQVLCQTFKLKEIFVGQHFAFGHKRAGKFSDLAVLGGQYGFAVHPVAPVEAHGSIVSSTRIRQLIEAGDVSLAARLLGRRYAVTGEITLGAQRGQALGWRTANLCVPPDRIVPPDGVYATVTVWNRRQYDSVSYIGTRPTFDAGKRVLEVHLLDQDQDLYGQSITVEFVQPLRDDIQFIDANALSRQIALDVKSARTLLRKDREVVKE
ncbi:MAG: bifunctional riboflavin kinase/FAD synthetase [Nitrospira sp.]|nr:bifunctional riboflavin kinase/FAD synthetase [Nitrospira sp.]